eukprot:g30256.t1
MLGAGSAQCSEETLDKIRQETFARASPALRNTALVKRALAKIAGIEEHLRSSQAIAESATETATTGWLAGELHGEWPQPGLLCRCWIRLARPEKPEVHVRTDQLSVVQSVNVILQKLDEFGLHLQQSFRPLEETPEECEAIAK